MQYDLGLIDPNETSGVELASMLTNLNGALRSAHRGTTRPSYAERGTMWVQDTGAVVLNLFFYDGVDDILIGTINTTTNAFTVSGSTVSLAALGGVPNTRSAFAWGSLVGGGSLANDIAFSLKGDSGSPPAGHYYGTNFAGTQGWHALSNVTAQVAQARPHLAVYGPGTSTFIAPAGITRVSFTAWGGGGGSLTQTDDPFGPRTFTGGYGNSCSGTFATIPGGAYTIVVGAQGAPQAVSTINNAGGGYVSATAGGATSIADVGGGLFFHAGGGGPAMWHDGVGVWGADGVTWIEPSQNISSFAPTLNAGRYQAGAPGNHGLVMLTYWF